MNRVTPDLIVSCKEDNNTSRSSNASRNRKVRFIEPETDSPTLEIVDNNPVDDEQDGYDWSEVILTLISDLDQCQTAPEMAEGFHKLLLCLQKQSMCIALNLLQLSF